VKLQRLLDVAGKLAFGAYISLIGAVVYSLVGETYLRHKHDFGKFRGYYNRSYSEINKEFDQEIKSLEKKISCPEPEKCFIKGKANVTIDIIIHKEVKLFFDDKGNPNDNSVWVDKVTKALEGLRIYEPQGFNMVLAEIKGTDFVYNLCSLEELVFIPQHDIALLFFPLKKESMNIGGFASPYGDHAVIFLNNFDYCNKFVLAHEMGHIFGLEHEDIFKILLDPLGVFFEHGLMSPDVIHGKFVLSKKDIAKLQVAKKRFYKSLDE